MGKRIKKGRKGEQSQYLTRSKAIRKMQLSLKDFRRICILKGIYPREPNKKFEGTNKTYYHVKDLKILMHDKLLERFREIKAHLKKHKKLIGRKEGKTAENHLKKTPKITLSHVIKERYPSIVDALKDLDDALCLIALFANLPQHHTLDITKKDVDKCKKLLGEFMLYCTVIQAFKKAFFSIKGVYYQVEIMGQEISWIVPYQFNQRLPFDVDYKVMNTFLEFYMSLLHFINFKVFNELGYSTPPIPKEILVPSEIREMQKSAQSKITGLAIRSQDKQY
jgi:pescadillo protein